MNNSMKSMKSYPTQIASHRGGTLEWGENCLRSFTETLKLPVELVEFDVHPTRDGRVIVHHDATLDRTTDLTGPVASKTWDEISRGTINYSGGNPIMLLEELCELYRGSHIRLRLEIKGDEDRRPYPGLVEKVLDILNKTETSGQCIISSFSYETLLQVKRQAPGMPVLWLVDRKMEILLGAEQVIRLAKAVGVEEVSVHISQLDKSMQQRVQDNGMYYGCYGAHCEAQIIQALSMNIRAFTTDRPTLALALREQMQSKQSNQPEQQQ